MSKSYQRYKRASKRVNANPVHTIYQKMNFRIFRACRRHVQYRIKMCNRLMNNYASRPKHCTKPIF